jgi:hypothetical protein
MENTSNLNPNGPDPRRHAARLCQEHEHLRRLRDAQERIEALEDLIRVLKYATPEALPRIRQEAAELLGEIWEL